MEQIRASLKNKIIFILSILSANIILDQVTKVIARNGLERMSPVHVIGNFFQLTLTENRGAFLGMGKELPEILRVIILIIVPTILIIVFTVYMFRTRHLKVYELVCFSTIIGGGFSNLIDRIFNNGYVTDFLFFDFGIFRTGVLNIADLSVTVGAVVLLIFYIKGNGIKGEKGKSKKSSDSKDEKNTPAE